MYHLTHPRCIPLAPSMVARLVAALLQISRCWRALSEHEHFCRLTTPEKLQMINHRPLQPVAVHLVRFVTTFCVAKFFEMLHAHVYVAPGMVSSCRVQPTVTLLLYHYNSSGSRSSYHLRQGSYHKYRKLQPHIPTMKARAQTERPRVSPSPEIRESRVDVHNNAIPNGRCPENGIIPGAYFRAMNSENQIVFTTVLRYDFEGMDAGSRRFLSLTH